MTKLIKKQTEKAHKGKKFINYTDLMLEQFGLSYTVYFVSWTGIKMGVDEHNQYMTHIENLRQNEITKPFTEGFEPPLITVMLFTDANDQCVIKAMSIRSKRDVFNEIEGINIASYYALMHMKNRGVYAVKKPSSIRALINCRMDMTVHSVEWPELNLFELSLLQSKKSLVKDIQEERVVGNYHNFNIHREELAIRKRENIISCLLDETFGNSYNPFSDSKGE